MSTNRRLYDTRGLPTVVRTRGMVGDCGEILRSRCFFSEDLCLRVRYAVGGVGFTIQKTGGMVGV